MRNIFIKRIGFFIVIFFCIVVAIYITGITGNKFNKKPLDILFPLPWKPTPKTVETCNKMYALIMPNGMHRPSREYYTKSQFDQLMHYTYYNDTKPYDWLVNGGALSAMLHIKLPIDDLSLSSYENTGMTNAAIAFLKDPQEGIRWEAAHLVTQQHLQGAASKVAEALKVEKNPLVIQEMQAALKTCGE